VSRSSVAKALVASQKDRERKPFNFYPTPFLGTVALMKHLRLPLSTRILEPACGEGHMSRVFALLGYKNVQSFDIRLDTGYGEPNVDFLKTKGLEADWIISNPPFDLAEDFVRHALTITGNVVLLLKVTYFSAAKRSALRNETKPAERLNLLWRLAFLEHERGNSPIMETMWVVWREGYAQDFIMDRELHRPAVSEVPLVLRVWSSLERLQHNLAEAVDVRVL
jgi:hypothetical protein